MSLTILEGSTFCICDELGDIGADATSGFFSDTRYLSTYRLTVSEAGEADGSAMRYRLELEPRERRELRVDVFPVERGDVHAFDASWDVRLTERHVTVERS